MSDVPVPPSPIPQADPRAGYRAHKAAIDAAIARMLEGGRYILGPEVAAFEHDFAAYIGARHAIGVASGTEALVLALLALDLKPDDYVATVSHTAVATVAAIELAGAKPLLIDIDPGDLYARPGQTRRRAGPAARPHRRGDPRASLRPRRRYGRDRRARAPPRLSHRRGLRAKPRRLAGGPASRQLRRSRGVQLLSDQESRRHWRWRRCTDQRRRTGGAACRAPRIWLAAALCQRSRRDEFAARRDAGGNSAREAAPSRRRQCAPPGDRRRL